MALAGFVAAMMTTMMIVTQAIVRDQDNADLSDALWEVIEALTIICTGYVSLVGSLLSMDVFLHDITPEEEAAPLTFKRRRHLLLEDLSNTEAYKMTHFFTISLSISTITSILRAFLLQPKSTRYLSTLISCPEILPVGILFVKRSSSSLL